MKKLLAFLFLSTAFMQLPAQNNDAAKFADGITTDGLKKHLNIIASDEFEGRETGTEGQRKAAAYIETQFRLLNLKTATGLNGYQQYYPLQQDSMLNSSLSIGDYAAAYETDYIVRLTNASGKFTSNQVVFAGYGIDDKNYNDYNGMDVKGKIVIIVLGEPKKDGFFMVSGTKTPGEWTYPGIAKKVSVAMKRGAAGMIIINPASESFSKATINDTKKSKLYYPRDTESSMNHLFITHALAKKIMGETTDSLIKKAARYEAFSKADAWEKNIDIRFSYEKKTNIIEASNVVGIIEGTDKKDEYVFLTGHYDHLGKRDGKIYYGADDDGSGTVAVMEMAAAFAKAKAAGKGPRRTVVFMTVSGEEKGLWGSEYYTDHPLFPLEKTSVDLNTDMVGRIDTERSTADTSNYVYVVGHDKISSELPVINEGVNNTYTGLTLDYKFDDPNDPNRIYFRSDHYNFARKGVPVLFFYDGMLKADYHKPTDTVDKINWALYEKRVRMIFHTAWEMANRDEMLKRDKPLPTETR
ncbi:MAG: M28 family peptidase [Bacteroidetes bacterium]|nr:M28 family peptidase [Bacteroidota bacterium]